MLHNDNYNKREYVVQVLMNVIPGMTLDNAVNIMQEAHYNGLAVVNIHCSHSDAGKKKRFDKKMERKDMGGNGKKKYKNWQFFCLLERSGYENKRRAERHHKKKRAEGRDKQKKKSKVFFSEEWKKGSKNSAENNFFF